MAVGRDVPIAPPRHRRGARLCISRTLARPTLAVSAPPRAPLRPVSAPPLRTRITRAARWGHRALPPLHTAYFPRALSHRHYTAMPSRIIAPPRGTRITHPTACGGSPPPLPVAARHPAAGTISHLPIPFLFSILAGTPFGKYACCFPAPAFPCFHEAPTPVQTAPRAFPRSPHFP